MSLLTSAELSEIVPQLRMMAACETIPEVRAAMIRLATLYASPEFRVAFTEVEEFAAAA